ncbi:MAG: Ig-like domain-containing protein, partial [Acidobacteria bacterium]|nr:Ig-like domain-containing protein [Acidobacteriota bacterium]
PAESGSVDGAGLGARFTNPIDVAMPSNGTGNAYVVDGNSIRAVDASGNVTTLATASGLKAVAGVGSQLYAIVGLDVVTVAKDGTMTTFATDATWNPVDLVGDGTDLYVGTQGDSNGGRVHRVDSAGTVTLFAGGAVYDSQNPSGDGIGTAARFGAVSGIAIDDVGQLWLSINSYGALKKIDIATAQVSTVSLSGFSIPYPAPSRAGLTWDPNQSSVLFPVSDRIVSITPSGSSSLLAGHSLGLPGSNDGDGTYVRFHGASAVAFESGGTALTVTESSKKSIRRAYPAVSGEASIDASFGPIGEMRQLSGSPNSGNHFWQVIRRPAGSVSDLSSRAVANPTFTPDVNGLYVFRLTETIGGVSQTSISETSLLVADNPGLTLGPDPLQFTVGGSGLLRVEMELSQPSDTTVVVSSSNSGVAAVPSSVTLPAGQRIAAVAVEGVSSGSASITAALPAGVGGATAVATVNVTAAGGDVLTLADGGACLNAIPGNYVDIPVYLRDASSTPLGTSEPAGNYIQALHLSIDYDSSAFEFPSFSSAGALSGLTSLFATGGTGGTGAAPVNPVDTNGDSVLDIADVVHLINHLFAGGPAPVAGGDANGDGSLTVSDVYYLLNYLPSGSYRYLASFSESSAQIPLTLDAALPGDRIGTFRLRVKSTVAAGTTLPMGWSTHARLMNQAGTVSEDASTLAMSVVNTCVTTSVPTVSLTPDPVSLATGASASMTATISETQGSSTSVFLSSSNTGVATVPSSVTLPSGSTSATFLVSGVSEGGATITATLPSALGGQSDTATANVSAGVSSAERSALLALYNATSGGGWTNNTNWGDPVGTECSWFGVGCDAGGTTITSLSLSSNGLDGTLPVELGDLTSLVQLWLDHNSIDGSIPSTLGNLSMLQSLNFSSNDLQGSIPPELGGLSQLMELGLEQNALGGAIPPELAVLKLDWLAIRYNALNAPDTTARAWADAADSEWFLTQTVAPASLTVAGTTGASATLSWTPISYTADSGGYEIHVGSGAGGPYTLAAVVSGKSTDTGTVFGLGSGTWYFVVRSFTEPHALNDNLVKSGFTTEVSATIASTPPTVSGITPASARAVRPSARGVSRKRRLTM